MFTVFLFYKEKECLTGEGCIGVVIPWQLCRTIGPRHIVKRFLEFWLGFLFDRWHKDFMCMVVQIYVHAHANFAHAHAQSHKICVPPQITWLFLYVSKGPG